MSTNYNSMKKEELIEAIKEKDNELSGVKSDIEQLKQMMLGLQKGINQTSEPVAEVQPHNQFVIQKNYDEDIVKIGSCLVGKHILCDQNKNEIVELIDFGDVASVSVRILDTIMTPANKTLFREGLVYFLDDKWYDRYSIKKNIVLDNETVDKLYALSPSELISEIDKMTNGGANDRVKYMIYWAIVRNIANGRDGYSDRLKEIELGNYFKTDIANSISLLQCAKDLYFN